MENYRAFVFQDALKLKEFLDIQNITGVDRDLDLHESHKLVDLPIVLCGGSDGAEEDDYVEKAFPDALEYATFLRSQQAIICSFQEGVGAKSTSGLMPSSEWILSTLLKSRVLKSFTADYGESSVSTESCDTLGQLLLTSSTLEILSLCRVAMTEDGFERIVTSLLNNPELVLRTFGVESTVNLGGKGAELMAKILLSETLKTLRVWAPGFVAEQAAPMARALALNTTLEALSIGSRYDATFVDEDGSTSCLLRALTPAAERLVSEGAKDPCGLDYNSTIHDLSIHYGRGKSLVENAIRLLRGNLGVTKLGLQHAQFSCEEWKQVFDALRENEHLEDLDLSGSAGLDQDQVFECLKEVVNSKHVIKRVKLASTPLEADGRSKQVAEILDRNGKMSAYLDILRRSLKFTRPCHGKVFVCGYPRSGKTTLSRNMAQGQRKSRRSVKHLCHINQLKSRKERSGLLKIQTSGDKHVTIWDMAEEDDYRALHTCHHLFPAINQRCMLLFVYHPYDDDGDGKKLQEPNAASTRLNYELQHWLNFVDSNSRKTGTILPQVSVVLTHLDKVVKEDLWFTNAERYVAWASKTVGNLREAFKGRLTVHEDIHAVDDLHVQHVIDHVMNCFEELFQTLPVVPAVGEELNHTLLKAAVKGSHEPIMQPEEFFKLCSHTGAELRALFRSMSHSMSSSMSRSLSRRAKTSTNSTLEELKLALQSYFHDAGLIINMEKFQRIVADPLWLCQDFLGNLFDSKASSWPNDGVVPSHILENNLDSFICQRQYKGITLQDLVNLMKELELCFTLENFKSPHYFIPRAIPDPGARTRFGRRQLHWTVIPKGASSSSIPKYRGFRLQSVAQSQNFLRTGVFHIYQFRMLQKAALDTEKKLVWYIEKNLVRKKYDGMEMLVESSGDGGSYVDILIRSFGSETTDMQKLYEDVLQEFRSICESRRECAGVTLEESILRPACVERLTQCSHRKDQAVSKKSLKDYLVKKLLSIPSEERATSAGPTKSLPENFLEERNHSHLFPAVPGANLDAGWVKATDMLTIADVKEATFEYLQSVKQQTIAIESAADELLEIDNTRTRAVASSSTSIERSPSHRNLQSHANAEPNDTEDMSQWQDLKLDLDGIEQGLHNDLDQHFRRLENKMQTIGDLILDELKEHKQLLKQLVQKAADNVQILHGLRQKVLIEKLDQVLCSIQGAQGIPRIPYFTGDDADLSQRILSVIKMGDPLKLHFMCEEPNKVHAVKEQQGYPVVHLWEWKVYERLRPILSASIKVMFILIKAGLHVGAGLGSAIENFTTTQGAVPLTVFPLGGEAVIDEVKTATCHEMAGDLADAWRCVQEIMAPLAREGTIYKHFKLYQVRYKSDYLNQFGPTLLASGRAYWVCADCRRNAADAKLLDETFNFFDPIHTPQRILHEEDITYH